MTCYKVALNDKEFKVELLSKNENNICFRINGQTHQVAISPMLSLQPTGPNIEQAAIPNIQHQATKGISSKVGCIVAPMPGIVVKVNYQPGQLVKPGDVLLVIEAMKMENNICANADGCIDSVFVKAGEQVKLGQELVKLA